ncbi:hypothetical protein ABPG72_001640 [Tetrahymena utriculariae]
MHLQAKNFLYQILHVLASQDMDIQHNKYDKQECQQDSQLTTFFATFKRFCVPQKYDRAKINGLQGFIRRNHCFINILKLQVSKYFRCCRIWKYKPYLDKFLSNIYWRKAYKKIIDILLHKLFRNAFNCQV